MKVLLIWVPFELKEIYGDLANSAPILPPLELAYMASYLISQGHEAALIDAHALKLSFKDIEGIIKKERPDLVGTTTNSPIFSFIYSVYSRALEIMRLVKKINPNIKTFLSGYHPTITPKEVLSNESVDYIIIGEGEITLLELCRALSNNKDLAEVAGIGFRKNGEIIINSVRPFIKNLDILPMPAYYLLPMDKYKFASDTPVPVKGIAIRANRGCAFNCYFCSAPGFWKRTVSTHSPEYIISTMNYLYKNYGYDRFQFHDDNFGINKEWVLKFCDLLLKNRYRFSWECYERFDLLEEEIVIMMKKAGCRLISLGVESSSDETLKKAKGLTKQKIEAKIVLLKKQKFKTRLFFMIGLPSKTKEDLRNIIRYAIRLDPDVFIATVSIPFPGSKFYDDMQKINCIPDFRNRLIAIYRAPCDFPGFTKEYLNKMVKQSYRRFYLRPGYIVRHFKDLCNIRNIQYYLKGLKHVF